MKITLRDYQVEAVKFAERVKKCLLCMRVGSGKTICAMFALRALLNSKKVDKAVVSCTKSSVSVFKTDFKEKAGLDVPVIESAEGLIEFLKGKGKVCIVKHSMFEKAGNDVITVKTLMNIAKDTKVALVVDEAHKIQNVDGVTHEAFQRLSFLFERVILLTATPYSSCLSQFYGLIHLIYPDLWKSKRAFFDRYIDEITIISPITHRVARKEKVRYKNLKEFRETIEPFTYFYYPSIPLVHIEHHTRLEDYSTYDDLCKGILRDEDVEKMEKAKKND